LGLVSEESVSRFNADPADELMRRFQPVPHPSKLAVEAMNCPPADLSAPIIPLPSLGELEDLVVGLLFDDDSIAEV
jgi:hypothetical protein